MKFQPSNFYISIKDLFAIIFPGAIASMAIYTFFRTHLDKLFGFTGMETFYFGAVLLLYSYVFGHIINRAGSYLDKPLYDNWWKDRKVNRKEKKAKINGKDYKNKLKKVEIIRKDNYNNDFIKEEDKLKNATEVSTFQWSLFKILEDQSPVYDQIERYTADSKFFRSLFLILMILSPVFLKNEKTYFVTTIFLVAAIFSLLQFFEFRWKATETAYEYIIYSEELNSKNKPVSDDHVLALINIDKSTQAIEVKTQNPK